MPNPENFPDIISVPIDIRPNRLTNSDVELIATSNKQVLFGTNAKDIVELWIYNPNGSLATHVTLPATDTALGLNTVIDNAGSYEFINLDMTSIINRIGLEQGRYQLVANFFRSEVGAEIGNKLYITDISPDRTELQLRTVRTDPDITNDIFEFIVPSVPRIEAQGLIDLVFNKTDDNSRIINDVTVLNEIENITPDTSVRISTAGASEAYESLVNSIISLAYTRTLNNMAADSNNLNIQTRDLESYIKTAVTDIIREYKDSGRVDLRFTIS